MTQREEYEKSGFLVIRQLFNSSELESVRSILMNFHEHWKTEERSHYNNKAVNSAYITHSKYLENEQRLALFRFIANRKISKIAENIFPHMPAFMNTQLFFNPKNIKQKNYWHRDMQFNGMSVDRQRKLLTEVNIIHFRIPLTAEPGLELIPGTHRRWDTEQEFNVRTEIDGRHCFENLPEGKNISLDTGDLLVFSANMIHRGLYGLDRLSFDILLCDATEELLEFSEPACFPNSLLLSAIENPEVYINAIRLKEKTTQ
jgi:ectoine hydroxylase-related dioxygenase (phytanoyl-CoA dioxygenase family)